MWYIPFQWNKHLAQLRQDSSTSHRFSLPPRKSTFTHESVRFFLVQTNGRSGSLVVLSSVAQSIVCTIEGTTTDTETKNLYLVESGADIRVKEEVSLFVSSTLSLLVSPSLRLLVF